MLFRHDLPSCSNRSEEWIAAYANFEKGSKEVGAAHHRFIVTQRVWYHATKRLMRQYPTTNIALIISHFCDQGQMNFS